MAEDDKRILPINYTNRDFSSIRDDLMDIAERYYPDTFKDFSEASFGALMLDTVAYVGDQLSFYLDYQANESFLNTAVEYRNVVKHARQLGYQFQGRPSTYGTVAIFILIPASTTGIGPDLNYIPLLKRGTSLSSNNGLKFLLTENIDFTNIKNKIVTAKVDNSTGSPTHFAIKTYGKVVSGNFIRKVVSIGSFERFKKIRITQPNISEIISVIDSDGNEYFEVPYLSQDIIYREISNPNFTNDNVPSILKPLAVPRRFVSLFDRTGVTLQFGTGNETLISQNKIPEPHDVALNVFGKNYTAATAFDPSNIVVSDKMGVAPSNTDLTITMRVTNPTNSNVAVGGLKIVDTPITSFLDRSSLESQKVQEVVSSIEVYNEEPIVGDVSLPTTDEIKRRVLDNFATQNRAITKKDYEALVYRMPSKFGAVKRCIAVRDPDSLKRNVNLYVISEDSNGTLAKTNNTIKNNLKTWLNEYKMINDTVDILDARIVNIGINFSLKIHHAVDKFSVLERCISTLKTKYQQHFYLGEPFYISGVYSTLNRIPGVIDVIDVEVIAKSSANYSSYTFNIDDNLSPEGRYVATPQNVILEIKFPDEDIRGTIK